MLHGEILIGATQQDTTQGLFLRLLQVTGPAIDAALHPQWLIYGGLEELAQECTPRICTAICPTGLQSCPLSPLLLQGPNSNLRGLEQLRNTLKTLSAADGDLEHEREESEDELRAQTSAVASAVVAGELERHVTEPTRGDQAERERGPTGRVIFSIQVKDSRP
ncbi:hypothetical protein AOLI_G00133000 [Acnodon oligacanthus]